MKKNHNYKIGEEVRSKMNWNRDNICKVIDIQDAVCFMDGNTLMNQLVQVQYSDDPEDVSGWLSTWEIEPIN